MDMAAPFWFSETVKPKADHTFSFGNGCNESLFAALNRQSGLGLSLNASCILYQKSFCFYSFMSEFFRNHSHRYLRNRTDDRF